MNQTIVPKMKNITKPANKPSPLDRLPDELVLHILNKVTDLRSLCLCKAACRRFSTMVHQVDTVSFTAPSSFNLGSIPSVQDGSVESKYFWSAIRSMRKFSLLKSVCMVLSPSIYGDDNDASQLLFNWMIKISNKFESYVFLSPNSVVNSKGKLLYQSNGEHEDLEVELNRHKKLDIACVCFIDAMWWYITFVKCVKDFPLLDKVYIRDSSKREMISFSGGKVNNWLPLGLPSGGLNYVLRWCCIPVLELPVSGYVMKEVTLVVIARGVDLLDKNIHTSLNYNEGVKFDDDDEAVYIKEAVMEIFKKHWNQIGVANWLGSVALGDDESK